MIVYCNSKNNVIAYAIIIIAIIPTIAANIIKIITISIIIARKGARLCSRL